MDIKEKIQKLKNQKNAVILVHNYQLPEIQDIADYRGDSLGLSLEASRTKADVIVFCGVYFMAETAKIISPEKVVLIPDRNAGCPMANMITAEQLKKIKQKHPTMKTLCYVNSSAEVKAESDICCTSANAVMIAEKAFNKTDKIMFIPDRHLAHYASTKVDRQFSFWPGYCPTHARILPEYIRKKKAEHPEAIVLVHPECSQEVVDLADQALSTGGMSRFVKESEHQEFIIGTETGMLYRLAQDNPDKKFYAAADIAVCPNMKKITLDKVLKSLELMKDEVTLPETTLKRAQKSIQRMIEYA
ncbi:MAG: quinolinate synthase NadA [Candidatus Omnitrophica bacterium]|nr:quinolinate synthase NadA [Candidatus Omnitrophota bacterium]